MRNAVAAGAGPSAICFAVILLIGPQAYWDVTNKNLGRVSIGFQSPVTDDIAIINLGSQMSDAAVHFNNAFRNRLALGSLIVTDLTWGRIAHNVDSFRGNFLRYDTPILVIGARIKF